MDSPTKIAEPKTSIAPRPTIEYTKEKIDLIKRTVALGANTDELTMFLYQARKAGLDPLARQIYFIKNPKNGRVIVQTSIDGFRVVAQRSGDYAGQDAPVFDEELGGPMVKCTVTVYRWRGEQRYPAGVGVAYWQEYAKPGRPEYPSMWDKMPHAMLAKVAESLALRKAFPQDLSGLYTSDEMPQDENKPAPVSTPITPVAPAAPVSAAEPAPEPAKPLKQKLAEHPTMGAGLARPPIEKVEDIPF